MSRPFIHADADGDELIIESGSLGATIEIRSDMNMVAIRHEHAIRVARELLEAAGWVADFPPPEERDDI